MKRLLYGLPTLACALLPLSAAAASPSPSPSATPTTNLSPSLDKVLIAPPSGFAPWSGASIHGRFTAHDLAQTYGVKSAEAERLVNQNGFVDGYGLYWINQSAGQIITEFVIAFTGGRGARAWLAYDKATDVGSTLYQHADTLTGVDQYFGVHMTQSSVSGQAFLDGFSFVKGNDEIGVGVLSVRDDGLNLATNQSKSQFTSAPAATIPPAQWPENAAGGSPKAQPGVASTSGLSKLVPYALIITAAIVAIGLVALLLLSRSRRLAAPMRAPVPPAVEPAMVLQPRAAAVPVGAAVASAPVVLPHELSADGNAWYDGQRWIDSSVQAPPFVQRSPDGAYWWDGYKWRPVPPVAQPPANGR